MKYIICISLLLAAGGWSLPTRSDRFQRPVDGVYNTNAKVVEGKLNVHLIPHSHDDTGWKKTVDQYFDGSQNQWLQPGGITTASVWNTLDTVIAQLEEDPARHFIEVEQAFFQRWWKLQTPTKQESVRKLVQNGQLEFINGGWCMHDEAATHFIDMIDQTTLGHRYINDQFNVTPRVGWQIDPFGHSATQASLLSAEAGFDSLFFMRIDYQDIALRRQNKSLEFVWDASASLPGTDIFTGVFHIGYAAPEPYNFDINRATQASGKSGIPWVDDKESKDYNIPGAVETFVSMMQSFQEESMASNIILPMGSDFAYIDANIWYRNMDRIIHYVNQDGRINVLYSTPSIYTDAIYKEGIKFPRKTDDFFPYASGEHQYWTGYFTSRPALKGYVRKSSALLQTARQLEAVVGFNESCNTHSLEQAVALAQHHDAVSGTERQHVADDYAERIAEASEETYEVLSNALGELTGISSPITFCPLANISICDAPEEASIIVYNPSGHQRSAFIRVPITTQGLSVFSPNGTKVDSQIVPSPPAILPNITTKPYTLVFEASNLPPTGYVVFTTKKSEDAREKLSREAPSDDPPTISNAKISLAFDSATGQLKTITNLKTNTSVSVSEQQLLYYPSFEDQDAAKSSSASERKPFYYPQYEKQPGPSSGAYVFRPAVQTATPLTNGKIPYSVVTGPVVQELTQFFNWSSSITYRLYENAEFVEVEVTVGSIPFDDGGKEVIIRYSTDIGSKHWYTDSNGREMQERTFNHRPSWPLQVNEPVAGNYYPVNSHMWINGTDKHLSLVVDRSGGGASLKDGSMELMLHRRLLVDDHKGVAEPLNETQCGCWNCSCPGLISRSKHFLSLMPIADGPALTRQLAEEMYTEPLVGFAAPSAFFASSFLKASLPANVQLVTLQVLKGGNLLMRFGHMLGVGEHAELAKAAHFSLASLLPNIKDITELSITANQPIENTKNRLHFETDEPRRHPIPPSGCAAGPPEKPSYTVCLGPMQIRTFEVILD